MDYLSSREEEGLDGHKPGWGEAQAAYDDLGPDAARLMSDEQGGASGRGEARRPRGYDGVVKGAPLNWRSKAAIF